MNKWIQVVINIVAAILSPVGIAWMRLMQSSYKSARHPESDGGIDITLWEVRGMFIEVWTNIPISIKEALSKLIRK